VIQPASSRELASGITSRPSEGWGWSVEAVGVSDHVWKIHEIVALLEW